MHLHDLFVFRVWLRRFVRKPLRSKEDHVEVLLPTPPSSQRNRAGDAPDQGKDPPTDPGEGRSRTDAQFPQQLYEKILDFENSSRTVLGFRQQAPY